MLHELIGSCDVLAFLFLAPFVLHFDYAFGIFGSRDAFLLHAAFDAFFELHPRYEIHL